MTRAELLQIAKPVLFNTEMVKAILEDRKTATRRLIKDRQYLGLGKKLTPVEVLKKITSRYKGWTDADVINMNFKEPYMPGDILYVRETWYRGLNRILYKANYSEAEKFYENGKEIQVKWHPSLHMPKEAARIFLKVKNVRVERLKDMNLDDFLNEGIMVRPEAFNDPENAYWQAKDAFSFLWNSTINKSDIALYGWDASPWVWVIEFERIEPDCEV